MITRKAHLTLLASLSLIAGPLASEAAQASPIGAFTTKGAYSFVSAPKLHPPKLKTTGGLGKRLAKGYFMVAVFKNVALNKPLVGQSGPLMLDSHLRPVWFAPVPTNVLAGNLRAQTYNGKPVLSWWQGAVNRTGATTSGEDVVVDQQYHTIATLTGKGGWIISQHEMLISGSHAWVTAYKDSVMGGLPTSTGNNFTDSAVQEYDLKTGNLLMSWDALTHIPLSQSQTRPSPVLVGGKSVPWDAYHVNSIQLIGSHEFLVSMRNTWGAYLVDIPTGSIVWVLGGKASTFHFGKNAAFQWQHDVEWHSGNTVSLFDDHCCLFTGTKFKPPTGPSRGLVLKLDTSKHTATLSKQYVRAPKFDAAFLGNTQLLSNGYASIGWGSQPFFSEYGRSGKLLLDAGWPGPDLSYRALVQRWVGKPFFPPSGGVRTRGGKTTVYASWDGATRVAKWRVLAGANGTHLKPIATQAKVGFETAIALAKGFKRYKVQALDGKGHLLGTSKLFPTPGGSTGPGFY